MAHPLQDGSAPIDAAAQLFQRLQVELEGLPFFLWQLRGPEHRIVRVETTGPAPFFAAAVQGSPLRDALHGEGAACLFSALDTAFCNGEGFSSLERRLRLPELLGGCDRVVDLSLVCEPTRDPGGAIDGLLVHGFDLRAASAWRRMTVSTAEQQRRARHQPWFESSTESSSRSLPPAFWQFSSPEPLTSPGWPRCKILVVDDSVEAAEMVADLLRALGQSAAAVYSGIEALGLLKSFQVDLCLLDLAMPGLDGWELARRIRAAPGPQPALVAFSSQGHRAARDRLRDAGFTGHLSKPVDVHALEALLLFLAARD